MEVAACREFVSAEVDTLEPGAILQVSKNRKNKEIHAVLIYFSALILLFISS